MTICQNMVSKIQLQSLCSFCNIRAICHQYYKRQFSINIKSFKCRTASKRLRDFNVFLLNLKVKVSLLTSAKQRRGSFPKIEIMACTAQGSSVSADEFVSIDNQTLLELALHQVALT